MKKIIVFLLAIGCLFAMISCDRGSGNGETTPATLKTMFAASNPTKIVVRSEQLMGVSVDEEGTVETDENGNISRSYALSGTFEYARGEIDGSAASIYQYSYEELNPIEVEGRTPIRIISGSKEYVYGYGLRVNGGTWDEEGENFAPSQGGFSLNLVETALKNFRYDKDTRTATFTVAQKDVGTVIGEVSGIPSDAQVSVTDDGAVITGITIRYKVTIAHDEEFESVETSVVTLTATYSYDLQNISLLTK